MRARLTALALLTAAVLSAATTTAQAPPTPPAPATTAPSPAPSTAAMNRIAYIDINRVVARSQAGAAVREQLEKERAGMQKEMDAKLDELKKLGEELEKKGPLLTADVRREKQEVFDRKRRDTTRLADDYQKELEKKERALAQKVLQEVAAVIEKVGKERGYYLIVDKRSAGVLYAANDADLTDEIIRAYDRDNAGAKGKK